MAISELTIDEYCTCKITSHRKNVRDRLTNYKSVLQDAGSTVWTANLRAECDLEISVMNKAVLSDISYYGSLDTEIDALYVGYSGSDWETDLDADVAALTALNSSIETYLDANFVATDPASTDLASQLDNTQKTAIAGYITTALG